jgi:hypothetical protein
MTDRNPRAYYLTLNGRRCTVDRPLLTTQATAETLRGQFPDASIELFEYDPSVGYGRPLTT